MDYKELFEANEWSEVSEIAIRLQCTLQALDEQAEILDSGEEPDKEVIADLIKTFFSDVSDLEDIKNTISGLTRGLYD